MSTYTPESRPSRWDAAKRVLLYIAAIAIVIWLFNIATQARSLAQSNAETVNVPIFQVAMVPGGPQRFNDEFEKALEARAEQGGEEAENLALEPADYLWMTLVVRNIGVESARDLEVELNTTAPIQQVFFAGPGWSNESAIEHEPGANSAALTFESLVRDDEAFIFIAMNPNAYEMPYTEEAHRMRARDFELYFERVHVDSDLAEALLYGNGYVAPEAEEGQSF